MCERVVHDFCMRNGVSSCSLLVAVSGGGDSVALFHLLGRVRRRLALTRIGVAHVNHGLRGEQADLEERFVAELAAANSCPLHKTDLRGKTLRDPELEDWARKERYRFFASLAAEHGYSFIATGHTADDQAETVLMRLARGTGLTGLCGIRERRDDNVVRPLIQLRREKLRQWLSRNGHTWMEDPTNSDQRFARNRMRYAVLPQLELQSPGAADRLAGLAGQARELKQYLEPAINKWVADHVVQEDGGRIVVRKPMADPDEFLASEGLVKCLREQGIPFDRRDIQALLCEGRRTSGTFLLKSGWRFCPSRDRVEIENSDAETVNGPFSRVLAVPGSTSCADHGILLDVRLVDRGDIGIDYDPGNDRVYLDAAKTGRRVVFRSACHADRFQGLGSPEAVPLGRFLKGHRVVHRLRRRIGVVAKESGEVLWIPGIAISHTARLREDTAHVIVFRRLRNHP